MATVNLRQGFIYGFLAFYVLYALGGIGMTGLLFSLAVGLIAISFDASLEISVASIILSGLAWNYFTKSKREHFTGAPTGKGMDANSIIKKVKQIKNNTFYEPEGVLSSSFAEGFDNPNQTAQQPPSETKPTAEAKPAEQKKDAPAEQQQKPSAPSSQPAPTNAPTATSQLANSLPTAGFTDKAADGMFKLGSIPPDAVGGSHIDIGTTMMNAFNSLKPDQVKQMTDDTQKLMETQKSLMSMLNTMKPMLQDGKQLMSTFNGMFGK